LAALDAFYYVLKECIMCWVWVVVFYVVKANCRKVQFDGGVPD